MASLAMDIADGCDDYLPLPPVEQEDADDDGYLPLPPAEQEDVEDYMQDGDDDQEEDDYGHLFLLLHPLARIIAPDVAVAGAPDDPAVADYAHLSESEEGGLEDMQLVPVDNLVLRAPIPYPALAEALKTVDAPSDGIDCPICMDHDEEAWKETPCWHRFHGRCVERWLQDKGSWPMCRRQVVKKTPTAATLGLVVQLEYGPDVAMELQDELLL